MCLRAQHRGWPRRARAQELPRAPPAQAVASAAHFDRTDLSAHGFYKTPDITGFGGNRPFSYFTYGAAASEVELDTLTGDFQVNRGLPFVRKK